MDSNHREVAVVIPTHNRPETLRDALRSVVDQQLAPVEAVVVDDMGEPRTAAVVDEAAHAARFPIRRLLGPGGQSASRNLGITETTAPVVAFLDDDDRWEPSFLAAATTRLAGVAFVVSPMSTFDGGAVGLGRRMPPGLSPADVVAVNPGFTGSNVVYRRSALEAVGGFDLDLSASEDKDLLVRLLAAEFSYAVLPDRLVARRTGNHARIGTDQRRRLDAHHMYMAKHRDRLTPADRRYLRGRIERIRRAELPPGPRRMMSTLRMAALLGWSGVRHVREDEEATKTSQPATPASP